MGVFDQPVNIIILQLLERKYLVWQNDLELIRK